MAVTLDEFIDLANIKAVDILKIDVEGEEFNVLQAGSKALNMTRLIYIELRLHNRDLAIQLLKKHGFNVALIYEAGLADINDVRFSDAWDYIAFKDPDTFESINRRLLEITT
jgi:hypothetical protein